MNLMSFAGVATKTRFIRAFSKLTLTLFLLCAAQNCHAATAATSISVSSEKATVSAGQMIELKATIETKDGQATGAVDFYDAGTDPKVSPTLIGQYVLKEADRNIATLKIDTLAVGNHRIIAQFQGGANFAACNSMRNPYALTVTQPK